MTATYSATGRAHRLGWLAIVAGAALLLSACGGGKKPSQPVAFQPPKPPLAAPPVKPPPKAADAKPKESPKPQEKPKAEPKPVEKPPLPEDVSKWKTPEYHRAKAEHHGKLPEALAYMAKLFAGTSNADFAANLVVSLIKPEPPPAAVAGAPGSPAVAPPVPSASVDSALLKAEIDALAVLGSPTARKCLEDLVAGTMATSDPKQAAELALEALAKNPTAQSDEILYRVLTARGDQRPAGAGASAAEELQKKAYAVVLPTASAELRLKLAAYALEATTPEEQQETLLKVFQAQDPANIPVQILLCQSDATAKPVKATLQGYFQGYNSDALARIMGMSPDDVGDRSGSRPAYGSPYSANMAGPPPGGPAKTGEDPELPYRLVRQFWDKKFAGILTDELGKLSSLETGAPTVVLAGTIPNDAMRAALYKALHKHCEEGPKALEAAGLTERVFCDPGLLAVFKSLPIRMPSLSHIVGAARTPAAEPRTRPGAASRPGVPAVKVSKHLSEEEWMLTCGNLAATICHRLEATVRAKIAAQKKLGHRVDFHDASAKRPIQLHSDKNVVVEYHLDWPEGLSGKEKLAGLPLDPMTIHYIRIEERGKAHALEGYYRHQFAAEPTCRLPAGLWLESFHTAPRRDRKISYDLLITLPKDAKDTSAIAQRPAAKAGFEKPADQERDLVIEILYLDVKDPSGLFGGGAAESDKDAPEEDQDAKPASP